MSLFAPRPYCVGHRSDIERDSTFLGFKRNEAFAELKRTMLSGLLDKALFWATELYISNCGSRLWETLCVFASQEVNLTNPNLPALVWQCYEHHYKAVLAAGDTHKTTPFHDYQCLRNHLTQLVAVLTLSHKARLPKLLTWKKGEPMDMKRHRDRIRRKDLHRIRDVVKISDGREVYIPLNEIDYALGNHTDSSSSRSHFLFWLSWLAEMERRSKAKAYCAARTVPDIPDKCRTHSAWVVWQLVFKAMEDREAGVGLTAAVQSLYKLFRTDYTLGRRRTRLSYLIHAGLLVIGSVPPLDFGQSVIPKPCAVLVACANINSFYKRLVDQKRGETYPGKSASSGEVKTIPNRPILYVPRICKKKETSKEKLKEKL